MDSSKINEARPPNREKQAIETQKRVSHTTHLWLYMPAGVSDVVHQEVLRQGRRRNDGHLVVQGHQVPRELPIHRGVGLVQDLENADR